MKDLINTLRSEFHRSADYRYAYDEEFANTLMATQIKVLRESHDPPLTQKQLAEGAGMKQSRISELENVAYSSWSISTLRRLARALGVRLVFKFESWGELLPQIETFSRDSLERPSFEHDPAFHGDQIGVSLPSDVLTASLPEIETQTDGLFTRVIYKDGSTIEVSNDVSVTLATEAQPDNVIDLKAFKDSRLENVRGRIVSSEATGTRG